jgi:signal transduction histidine kinase
MSQSAPVVDSGSRPGLLAQLLAASDCWETLLREAMACRGATTGRLWLQAADARTWDLAAVVAPAPAMASPQETSMATVPVVLDGENVGCFVLSATETVCVGGGSQAAREVVGFAALLVRQAHRAQRDQQDALQAERNRLAGEIHDGLAQHFAGILLQLGIAQRIVGNEAEAAWRLVDQAGQLARTALAEARRSLWALQPPVTDEGNLGQRLTRQLAQLSVGSAVPCRVRLEGSPHRIPPELGTNLLRVSQEAVSNALGHADARQIDVELTVDDALVRLCIRDDGRGFDPGAPTEGDGFGLIGMRQRVEHMGGWLTLASRPGEGTEVTVYVATVLPGASEPRS